MSFSIVYAKVPVFGDVTSPELQVSGAVSHSVATLAAPAPPLPVAALVCDTVGPVVGDAPLLLPPPQPVRDNAVATATTAQLIARRYIKAPSSGRPQLSVSHAVTTSLGDGSSGC